MVKTFVDFASIKQQVTMRAVLDYYRIQLRQANDHSLRGHCPLPTHTSEKSKESFTVHLGKNIWSCQSSSCSAARQGKKGGNILDFVAVMENCSVRDAAIKLSERFGNGAAPTQSKTDAKKDDQLVVEKKVESEVTENKPLSFTLKDVDPNHAYLRDRGISEEVAKVFGVGFFPGRGLMSGRIVIPIHNERGELVGYAGRSIDNAEPKYKLPTGFQKSLELFNFHRAIAIARDRDCVIVVEGFFDCIKVHQSGFPNVVALMGSSLSQEQQRKLSAFKRVVLVLDGDEAGRDATKTIAERLVHSQFVKAIPLAEGKQPDQLSRNVIRSVVDVV